MVPSAIRSRALLACVLLLPGGCDPQLPNLDSPGTTIVCFGDSITYGVGAGSDPTYPELLAERLGTEVINAGLPGETSAEGRQRLDEILAHDPWLVIVELGGNDLLRRRPLQETETALREIVEILLEQRVLPVLVEIHGPFGGDLAELFESLAGEYRVPLVADELPRILRTPSLKSDPIHPNGAGYAELAAAIGEVVEEIVKARRELR